MPRFLDFETRSYSTNHSASELRLPKLAYRRNDSTRNFGPKVCLFSLPSAISVTYSRRSIRCADMKKVSQPSSYVALPASTPAVRHEIFLDCHCVKNRHRARVFLWQFLRSHHR